MAGKRAGWGRVLAGALLAALLLVVVLATISALANRGLPRRSPILDRLGPAQTARLAEAIHLRQALGDSIWPGFGREDIPVVLYNERFAFLTGIDAPAPGWIKVPGKRVRGGAWQPIPGDSLNGTPCYRQPLPIPRVIPEAFTVRVGDRWAASVPTYEWFCIDLASHIRHGLPAPLAAVFPYGLAQRLMIGGVEGYVCITEHESFHAFQGRVAPERLVAAERAATIEDRFPSSPAFEESWRRELGLLASGASARARAECDSFARRFLDQRRERRAAHRLAPELVACERAREWLEGVAKYVEVESWRRAAQTPGYRPVRRLAGDHDFHSYSGFDRKWAREVTQIHWGRDDTRFYGSGFAQAEILDRLMPGWKLRAFTDSTSLEDLVAEAVRQAR